MELASIRLIAHRGSSADRAENTIASFDLAMEQGFSYLELDVHLAKDGVPVVMHDSDVDRTSNASGPISSYTSRELSDLDVTSWFKLTHGDPGAVEGVPTLDEVLSRYKENAHIFIEIKSGEVALISAIEQSLKRVGWLKNRTEPFNGIPGASIISFDPDQVIRSKNLLQDLGHGLLVVTSSVDSIRLCYEHGIQGYFPYLPNLTRKEVQMAEDFGLVVGGWGISRLEELDLAIDLKVWGVTVNWPQKAAEYLSGSD